MLTPVRLYGPLGARFGRRHAFAIGSPAEALRALAANHPGFLAAIATDGRYRVSVGKRAIDAEEIAHPSGNHEIRIVPLVSGAGGAGRFLLGAALIATAWINPGGVFAAEGLLGAAAGQVVGAVGWSLAIGGVSSMLTKTTPHNPASTEAPQNRPSYAFDGPVNTTAQGNAVPILYGRLTIGSQVISAGLYAEEFA